MEDLLGRVLDAQAPPPVRLGEPGCVERLQERHEVFARATEERAELFARLRCPESIRKPKSR